MIIITEVVVCNKSQNTVEEETSEVSCGASDHGTLKTGTVVEVNVRRKKWIWRPITDGKEIIITLRL